MLDVSAAVAAGVPMRVVLLIDGNNFTNFWRVVGLSSAVSAFRSAATTVSGTVYCNWWNCGWMAKTRVPYGHCCSYRAARRWRMTSVREDREMIIFAQKERIAELELQIQHHLEERVALLMDSHRQGLELAELRQAVTAAGGCGEQHPSRTPPPSLRE